MARLPFAFLVYLLDVVNLSPTDEIHAIASADSTPASVGAK
jgi:hypothetical protein